MCKQKKRYEAIVKEQDSPNPSGRNGSGVPADHQARGFNERRHAPQIEERGPGSQRAWLRWCSDPSRPERTSGRQPGPRPANILRDNSVATSSSPTVTRPSLQEFDLGASRAPLQGSSLDLDTGAYPQGALRRRLQAQAGLRYPTWRSSCLADQGRRGRGPGAPPTFRPWPWVPSMPRARKRYTTTASHLRRVGKHHPLALTEALRR